MSHGFITDLWGKGLLLRNGKETKTGKAFYNFYENGILVYIES